MRLLALWGATAGALLGWSEYVFVNEGPAAALLGDGWSSDLLAMGLFYLLPAAAFLALARLRPLEYWWQAVLAGGITGWVIEGVVVPAVYEAPPVSFLWTSLAWHAPVDVALGLWVLPRLLRADARRWSLVATLLLAGTGAGVWALWTTGMQAEALNLSASELAKIYAVATPLLAAGALAWAAWSAEVARLPLWAAWSVLGLCGALGAVQGSVYPAFLAALSVAVALVMWVFLRNRPIPTQTAPAVPPRALWFAGFAALAVAAYATFGGAETALDPEILTFCAFVAGSVVFLVAVWKGFTWR
ncbi:MAG: hypothetical protein AAFP13_06605 [Pseudomonadota bacterium]